MGDPGMYCRHQSLETSNSPIGLGQRRIQDKEEVECQSFRCDAEKTWCKIKGREEEPKVIHFLSDRFNSLVEKLGSRTQEIITK